MPVLIAPVFKLPKGFKRVKSLEKAVDKTVREHGEARGGVSIKLTMLGGYGSAGWPDRLWLFPGGLVFFIELKKPGKAGDCTDLQLQRHAQLRALGLRVYVCDDPTAGKLIINNELRKQLGRK